MLCFCAQKSQAQEASVEKSIWGVQTLMLPLSVYNESRLSNSIALRSEFAWGFGWTSGGFIDNSEAHWAALPYINVEPRYYFNLEKRRKKRKRIDNNCGNYLSLCFGYQPGFGITSGNVNLNPIAYIIPTYGLRRNIGKHFNFEFAFGIGKGWEFREWTRYDGTTFHETYTDRIINLRLAFGYVF